MKAATGAELPAGATSTDGPLPIFLPRAGLQFENPDFLERKLQLLMEYYSGKSPHGQFYENTIEHFGVGLHFFFD
jgi:hypothetical protein